MNAYKEYGEIKKTYQQKTIRKRIEAFFLDNIGKIIKREQIIEVAKDPKTGKEPENWHQRLSELRTDEGYTILSWRDAKGLKISEYVMPHSKKRLQAKARISIDPKTWQKILQRSNHQCEWEEDGITCELYEGKTDHIGGGTVRLTPDHKSPHSLGKSIDSKNPDQWQVLCGRHQVTKKNYWDNITGKLNVIAIIQSASKNDKKKVFEFLKNYFEE